MTQQQNQMIIKGQKIMDMVREPDVQSLLVELVHERKDEVIAALMSIAQTNNTLAECTRETLLGGVVKSVSLGLRLDPAFGEAWLIPRKNKTYNPATKTWEEEQQAVFQVGWKGYKTLALRTGRYTYLNATDVKAGEYMGLDSDGEALIMYSADINRWKQETIGYAASFKMDSGYTKTIFWARDQVIDHITRYSDSYRKYVQSLKTDKPDTRSAWATSFDAMARKIVLSYLLRTFGDTSGDRTKVITEAYAADQAAITYKKTPAGIEEGVDHIDNQETPAEPACLSTQQLKGLLNYVSGDPPTTGPVLKERQDVATKCLREMGYTDLRKIPAADYTVVMAALEKALAPEPDLFGGSDNGGDHAEGGSAAE